MSDFPGLASKFLSKTFVKFAKPLSIFTVGGSCENGTAIDITKSFTVDGAEDFDYVLVTDVNQWVKKPDVGNIDLIFNRTNLKIVKIDEDAAQAAYFIHCKTYERQAVTIQALTATPDGRGGFSEAWGTHVAVEAEITYLDGKEALKHGRLANNQLVKMKFRFTPGITEDMRAVFDGDNMPIRSITNFKYRSQWIEIIVERDVAS